MIPSSLVVRTGAEGLKLQSRLTFSGPHMSHRTVRAVLAHRRDMELKQQLPCWHVANNAAGLIKGLPVHYSVPHLLYKRSSFVNFKVKK